MVHFVWALCAKFTREFLENLLQFFPWAEDVRSLALATGEWTRAEWESTTRGSREALELVAAGQHDAAMKSCWGFLQKADFAHYYGLVSPRSRGAYWDALLPALRVHGAHELVQADLWASVGTVFGEYSSTCPSSDWKTAVVELVRDPVLVARVLAVLPEAGELRKLLLDALPLVRSFRAPRYEAPEDISAPPASKSARRRARRARKAAERKNAEFNQFAPFVAELEKVIHEGFEVSELNEMLEIVRACVEGACVEKRKLGISDLWSLLEKVAPNEEVPSEFKDALSSMFESGGFDFSNPMHLFEKLASSLNLNSKEMGDVSQQVELLQRSLTGGAPDLGELLQKTLGSSNSADLSAFTNLFAAGRPRV